MHRTDLRKISDLRQLGNVFAHVAQKPGQVLFYDDIVERFLRVNGDSSRMTASAEPRQRMST